LTIISQLFSGRDITKKKPHIARLKSNESKAYIG